MAFIGWPIAEELSSVARKLTHSEHLPDVVSVERTFSPDTVNLLKQMGYNVQIGLHDGAKVATYWSDAECVAIDEKTGERLGGSDGRNSGKAVGY